MIKRIILTLFVTTSIVTYSKGQQTVSNIYTDSLGQVFVQTNSPVYFFIAPDNKTESRFPIPNNGAAPMYFKSNGTHFIKADDAVSNNPVGFKIIADGTATNRVNSIHKRSLNEIRETILC